MASTVGLKPSQTSFGAAAPVTTRVKVAADVPNSLPASPSDVHDAALRAPSKLTQAPASAGTAPAVPKSQLLPVRSLQRVPNPAATASVEQRGQVGRLASEAKAAIAEKFSAEAYRADVAEAKFAHVGENKSAKSVADTTVRQGDNLAIRNLGKEEKQIAEPSPFKVSFGLGKEPTLAAEHQHLAGTPLEFVVLPSNPNEMVMRQPGISFEVRSNYVARGLPVLDGMGHASMVPAAAADADSDAVLYAGSVTFNQDLSLKEWTNNTGHFQSHPGLARNVDLPLDKFKAVHIKQSLEAKKSAIKDVFDDTFDLEAMRTEVYRAKGGQVKDPPGFWNSVDKQDSRIQGIATHSLYGGLRALLESKKTSIKQELSEINTDLQMGTKTQDDVQAWLKLDETW